MDTLILGPSTSITYAKWHCKDGGQPGQEGVQWVGTEKSQVGGFGFRLTDPTPEVQRKYELFFTEQPFCIKGRRTSSPLWVVNTQVHGKAQHALRGVVAFVYWKRAWKRANIVRVKSLGDPKVSITLYSIILCHVFYNSHKKDS